MSLISTSALIELAVDLTKSLNNQDRFERLLATVRQTIACDAVVILHCQGRLLKPLAQMGLSRDALGRRFQIDEHPRFAEICGSQAPVRFAADSPLPDPYDGMMLSHEGNLPVHACMGLPLFAEDSLLGVLTLDSMTPGVFDDIPKRTLDIVAAMSAATLNTAILLEQMENLSRHNQQVVTELTSEALHKDGGELIGSSPEMQKLKREISLVAPSDYTVLIEGETGVGKELVARTLHRESMRSDKALVYVNCAAIPETLVESELFGHVKGAFTGAQSRRAGKFSLANAGTLFLDEIGELPLSAQSKLLRALQNQEIQPVGQDEVVTVDVRVLAATNRDLEQEVKAGRFRADLYHRLSVYPIRISPLRERKMDVVELAGFFCEQVRRKLGLQHLVLSPLVEKRLEAYDWPGNIRELEHVISRAALRARSQRSDAIVEILATDLALLESGSIESSGESSPIQSSPLQSASIQSEPTGSATETSVPKTVEEQGEKSGLSGGGLKVQTDRLQQSLIIEALNASDGNWSAAARLLDYDRANLRRLAKRLGVRIKREWRVE
jgi:anaerobic nitric oxide reductase transcription regulator